jgi:hypothetical protein
MRRLCTSGLLVLVALNDACGHIGKSDSPRPQTTSPFAELMIKRELQQTSIQQTNAKVLSLTPFRSVTKGAGAQFVFPASLSYSESGTLYISDNNGHRIHYWRVDSPNAVTLEMQPGEGRLKFPNSIECSGEHIFISDNDGIKIFSADGKFERLIRPYFGIFSFIKSDREGFFANTLIRNANSTDPLIVELDRSGKEIRGLGLRQNITGHNGLEDQAFLALSHQRLFAAFKYRPHIEIYDLKSGKLTASFDVAHPVFQSLANELERRGIRDNQENGRVFLPRYLAGIRVFENRIFLCLALPEPEIWEIDRNGKPLAQFHISGLPPAVDVFGFDIRSVGNSLIFSLGIIDQGWNATVSELRSSSN